VSVRIRFGVSSKNSLQEYSLRRRGRSSFCRMVGQRQAGAGSQGSAARPVGHHHGCRKREGHARGAVEGQVC